MDNPAAVAFWISTILLLFTYAGYPFLITLLSARRKPPEPVAEEAPVCVIVVAHNEQSRIAARVRNLLASDYPPHLLRVLVVSDGSTDGTAACIRELREPRVAVLEQNGRMGKAAGLNAGIAAVSEPVIVFTDARQTFAPDTIRRLVSRLGNPAVGAVSGELTIESAADGTGRGVDAYWKLERFIRARESLLDSCIGCTGAVYAIRRELFTALPEDTVLDDVVIPMRIALAGKRVIHDSTALAYDPQQLEPAAENRRKRRTLAGNFQMLFRYPRWLIPWKNRLWWQLIAHKYLRLCGPLLLLAVLGSSLLLCNNSLYRTALLFQAAFYVLAALGMLLPIRSKIVTLPAGFVFLNAAVVRAFWHYLVTPNPARWQTKR